MIARAVIAGVTVTTIACRAPAPTTVAPPGPTPGARPTAGPAAPMPAVTTYDRDQLGAALADARQRTATAPQNVEPWRVEPEARLRRGRVALLSRCADLGEGCPPVLASSDPPPPVETAGDASHLPPPDELGAWVDLTGRIWRAACACATWPCVDGWTEELRRLEARVPAAWMADAAAAAQVTDARACLATLRAPPS